MEEPKITWDRLWQGIENTVTDRDVLYMVDEIKLEYTLGLLQTSPDRITTIEVGAGSGRLSCFLASSGYKTICLDHSPDALRVASNNYKLTGNEGIFILADAIYLPFKSNSFDVVLSTGLLEHFPNAQPVVDEMARILKPGGYFVSDIVPKKLLVPFKFGHYLTATAYAVTFRILKRPKSATEPRIHEQRLTKQDITRLLESAGLEDINVFAAGVLPSPPLDLPRAIPFQKHAGKIYNEVVYRLKPFFKIWDGTLLAEWFGLYYFVHARKPR
jgi:ubiquinone/menaquinone biosynthesis C-methylase UbiE